ncbi:MAG: hypothetical protein KA735_04745 [Burkholderiaceae bacterium]|nr:hypothetical protein [Burkholderiaceae bacterium]
MRNVSQTLIGILREEISTYRRLNRLSRETITQNIVEAHERLGIDAVSGIRFEPKTTDAVERQKVNADRVFRWLDDETKDSTLLPANFLPSVLAGIPEDVQRRCLDRILMPLGFAVRALADDGDAVVFSAAVATHLMKEQGEAAIAVVGLADGYNKDELLNARREVAEAVDAGKKTLQLIETQLAVAESRIAT